MQEILILNNDSSSTQAEVVVFLGLEYLGKLKVICVPLSVVALLPLNVEAQKKIIKT